MPSDPSSRLARRLTTTDAVVLGLGSMIGAGVFAAIGPAAGAAGTGLLAGLIIAGLIALFNAASVSQLATLYPQSGGTYVYGRERLSEVWGFLAGWSFLIGKMASCSAMALTFAHYTAPHLSRPLAIGAVLLLTVVNYFGVKKTATMTKAIVALVLLSLAIVIIANFSGGTGDFSRFFDKSQFKGLYGILQSAGILFFAFAGYARIATLGEEVISPKTAIPKAIGVALGLTLLIYLLVMVSALFATDVAVLAASADPLAQALRAGEFAFLSPAVRIGAAVASLGVLLSLLAGISRTTFAMAAEGDLPKWLSAVHPRYHIPHRADLLIGLTVCLLLSFTDLLTSIGFSSFAILTYYSIAHMSALTLKGNERRWPSWMPALGLAANILIVLSLPLLSIVSGITLLTMGLVAYLIARKN